MYGLEGKVAVVTGVGRPRGIGRATALRLAREGVRVVLADLGQGMSQIQYLRQNGSEARRLNSV